MMIARQRSGRTQMVPRGRVLRHLPPMEPRRRAMARADVGSGGGGVTVRLLPEMTRFLPPISTSVMVLESPGSKLRTEARVGERRRG